MAILFAPPFYKATDIAGDPIPGAFLSFYATGTTTLQSIFSDVALQIPLTNPLQADGNGAFPAIWLDDSLPQYKYVLAAPDTNDPTVPGSVLRTGDPYNVPLDIDLITKDLYPQTATEQSLGITPTFYVYAPSPRIDVRRHLSAWDDGSDQTAGLQTAVNLAYAEKGRLILPNGFHVQCSGISLTMPTDGGHQGLAIEGPGYPGALFTKTGSPTSLFTFSGATPTGNPNDAPLILEGFAIDGVDKAAHGITLSGIGNWCIRDTRIYNCFAGINLSSALDGRIERVDSVTNNYGLQAQRNGSGSGCNRISVRDSRMSLNTTFGIFLASGSNWLISGVNIESNGTSANLNTGGLRITPAIDDEFGFAMVQLESCWFENNLGQPFLVDSTSGLTLALQNVQLLSGEGFREILISGASKVSIRDSFSPGGGGDVWNITCNELILDNTNVTTLTDASTTPSYRLVRTSTTFQPNGRASSYTGTLTGVSGTVTGTIQVNQQGQNITLSLLNTLTGTSTSTACTITGMPAAIRPSSQRIVPCALTDNSVDAVGFAEIGSDGTIILVKPGGFTASGTKGLQNVTFAPYSL